MKLVHHNLKILLINLFLLIQYSSIVLSINEIITSNEYYPYERDALIQLRESMSSKADLHSKWTGPPCNKNDSNWVGVSCSNGHVVHLVLEGIELNGILPPTFLLNITFLTKLSFRNNSITGPLPNLTNLNHLEFVLLSQNHFWSSIPLEFTQLPKLKTLELQDNYLDGEIPPFNQSTLTVFNVSNNHLVGPIPNTSTLHRFPRSCFDHNSGLCGPPMDIPCPISPSPAPSTPPGSPSSPPAQDNNKKKKKNLQPWNIALIAGAAALVPFFVIIGFLCYYRVVYRKEGKKEVHEGMV